MNHHQGPVSVLEDPEMFSHTAESQTLWLQSCLILHVLNMNRGSLHTRRFRRIHYLFLDTDELKMALQARKVYGTFEKRAPGLNWVATGMELNTSAESIYLWGVYIRVCGP